MDNKFIYQVCKNRSPQMIHQMHIYKREMLDQIDLDGPTKTQFEEIEWYFNFALQDIEDTYIEEIEESEQCQFDLLDDYNWYVDTVTRNKNERITSLSEAYRQVKIMLEEEQIA